uniref:JmjC domain-containing protein n=1 Tax=Phytophthora ramorum TaxID=164328 RepID=H3GYD0_PHYRM
MTATFIESLARLIDAGDYGGKHYDLEKIKTRLSCSKDRYISSPFSWQRVVESNAPALLFRGACDIIAGVHGYKRIPTDPQHLRDAPKTTSVIRFVEEAYYSKLKFSRDEAYVYKSEYWMQVRNRESPIHVDHGRVVSYIPPCAKDCFKVWVFFPPESEKRTVFNYGYKDDSINRMLQATGSGVLVQRPGDVVVLNNLVFHSVLLVYKPGTPETNKWGGVFGDIVVREKDRCASFRYATKVASGAKKGSREAWESLLSAYSMMEEGDYAPEYFEEEKKKFMAKLE